MLEQKNNDLEKMNKELESFAYVASHDLQEPLRKIQIFAGRIIGKDIDRLSENGKEQLIKIDESARRMQNLIKDLFSYTKIDTEEQNFETIDITTIVQEVIKDFQEELIEKNATVEVSNLCEAEIISFQFYQVFQNLIGNS